MDPNQHRNALSTDDKLHWYEIKSILGQGGFGITYLALDNNLKQNVAIKEYMPTELATRAAANTLQPISDDHSKMFNWGLDRFLDEARTLARFKHPNIVRVHSVFEGNNTAYMVMEYEEGADLSSLIKNNEKFDEKRLLDIVLPILEGLQQVHELGFIHRDIKPHNIFIRKDGSPVLIDFGSARQALGGQTRTLTSLVTPGFAPFEQYHDAEGKQGPWTDIYSLAATCYCAITGKSPAEALKRGMARLDHDTDAYLNLTDISAGKFSQHFLEAIDCGLRFREKDRPQNVSDWRGMLLGKTPVPPIDEEIRAQTQKSIPEVTVINPSLRETPLEQPTELLQQPAETPKPSREIPGQNSPDRNRPGLRGRTPGKETMDSGAASPAAKPARGIGGWLIGAISIAGICLIGVAAFLIMTPQEESPGKLQNTKSADDSQVTSRRLQAELDKQKALLKQVEIEKQAALQKQAELEEQAELKSQAELRQLTELKRQAEMKERAELEQRAALTRQKEKDKRQALQRKTELERQAALERKAAQIKQAEIDRLEALRIQAEIEKQGKLEKEAALRQQAEIEKQAVLASAHGKRHTLAILPWKIAPTFRKRLLMEAILYGLNNAIDSRTSSHEPRFSHYTKLKSTRSSKKIPASISDSHSLNGAWVSPDDLHPSINRAKLGLIAQQLRVDTLLLASISVAKGSSKLEMNSYLFDAHTREISSKKLTLILFQGSTTADYAAAEKMRDHLMELLPESY